MVKSLEFAANALTPPPLALWLCLDHTRLLLFSLVGHWLFAWFAYTSEQIAHNQPIQVSGYLIQTLRDTLENWQSEFLQLLWQVGGLAILLHLGSPQSKEGSDRVEEKIDAILRRIDPEGGDKMIAELDRRFERQPDDPPEHRFRGA